MVSFDRLTTTPPQSQHVTSEQLEAAAQLVQRNLANVKEPAGLTAISHEAGDAPRGPKQEVEYMKQ